MKMALFVMLLLAVAAGRPAHASSAAAPRATAIRAGASSRAVLPFIADDYPKAVALARARKVPIFVESWAPW